MRVKLFDGLDVEIDGQSVTSLLPGLKGRTTLAYLAVNHPEGAKRDELVEVLWPLKRPSDPRANLRTLLSRIRDVLGVDALTEGDKLQFTAHDVEIDLQQARGHVAAARAARDDGRAAVAVEAARAAVDILDAPVIRGIEGDWVERLRRTVDEELNDMLSCIAEMGSLAGGELGVEAIAAARELVERDGYLERSHAHLMRALARAGERAEALRVFESIRAQLDEELAALPGPELQELHQAILREEDLGTGVETEIGPLRADQVPLPTPVVASTERTFVGRDRELARIVGGTPSEGGAADENRVVTVAGPPGIGKSVLAAHAAHRAARHGHFVLFGRCDDEMTVPYQPFTESIGHLVRALDADEIARLLGRVHQDLARILPDLEAPRQSHEEPDTERHRLFDAVAHVLRELSGAAPVLLVVDDVHSADRPTQLMLRHVVRATRDCDVTILATHRDTISDHANGFAELVADLVREVGVNTVTLDGLDEDETRHLVETELQSAAPASVVDAISARTEGNPLFARELARDYAAHVSPDRSDQAEEDATAWPVPDGIQQVVARRCALLSDEDQALITRAATLGRVVSPDDLAVAADVPLEVAMNAFEGATTTGMMRVSASETGAFSFVHPLLREAVLAAISPPRLGRLHLENAERLERRWPAEQVAARVADLAHHRLAAAEAGLEVATAVDWLDKAAAHVEGLLAYEASAALYTRALALLEDHPSQRRRRAGLLLRLAASQWRSGHREDSRASRRSAFDLAFQVDDSELMAMAAIGHERYFEINRFESDESALARDALAALPDEAMERRAQVLARCSRIDHWSGDHLRTSAVAEDAVKIAQECGDDVVLADAYNALLFAYRGPSHPIPERLDAASKLIAIGRRLGSEERRLEGEAHRLIALVEGGRTQEIRGAVERFGRIVQGVRQPFWVYYRQAWAATLAFVEGDLTRSAELHETATQTATGARSDAADGGAAATVQRVVEQGQARNVADLAEQFATDGIHPGVWRAGVAMVKARAGRTAEATAIIDELVGPDGIRLARDVLWGMAGCLLADAAHAIGHRDAAQVIMRELEPIPRWIAMAGSGRGFLLVSQRLGQLAQVTGDHARALAHFDQARQQGVDLSADLIVAWADLESAATLLDRDAPGDAAGAQRLLESVTEFAAGRDLGLIEQRIAALRGEGEAGLAFAV